MADELELQNDGIDIPESQEQHEQWEPTAAEQKAMAGGWKPESEWEGDPDEWVSAREFNFRGELMSRITSQGRQIGALEGKLGEAQKLISASDRVTQRLIKDAVEKTKRDLRSARREALAEGDAVKVDEIDEELDGLKETEAELKRSEGTQSQASADQNRPPTPVEAAWFTYVQGAEWMKDPAKGQPMLQFAQEVVNKDPYITVDDFMDQVLDKSKELRGVKPARATPPGGPDDTKGGSRPRKQRGQTERTAADLNEQREIGRGYVAEGLYKNLDEYAKARFAID